MGRHPLPSFFVLAYAITWTILVPEFDLIRVLGVFLIQLFFLSLVTGSLGEEIGWRGFALPRLQERQNPLSASLFLGTLWALWHLPTFLVVGSGQSRVPMVWLWFEIFGSTFLWTWVYNNTQDSLLMAFLLHAALNVTSNVLLLAAMAAGWATS